MRTIHKYPLQIGTKVSIELPSTATIIKAGMQGGQPHIWVDLNHPYHGIKVIRSFEVFGTGWEIPTGATYIDTVFQGQYVWHVYDVP